MRMGFSLSHCDIIIFDGGCQKSISVQMHRIQPGPRPCRLRVSVKQVGLAPHFLPLHHRGHVLEDAMGRTPVARAGISCRSGKNFRSSFTGRYSRELPKEGPSEEKFQIIRGSFGTVIGTVWDLLIVTIELGTSGAAVGLHTACSH